MDSQPTIKERLTARFIAAQETVGPNWRKELAKNDPFFDSKLGSDIMLQVSGIKTRSRTIGVDRLERVVIALEKIVEDFKTQEA